MHAHCTASVLGPSAHKCNIQSPLGSIVNGNMQMQLLEQGVGMGMRFQTNKLLQKVAVNIFYNDTELNPDFVCNYK